MRSSSSSFSNMFMFILACAPRVEPPPAPAAEPLPSAEHRALEEAARVRVPDPRRNGPEWRPDASPLPPFLGVDRGKATYIGSETCAACHVEEAAAWRGSAHAGAMHALEEAKAAYNPDCFRCHVTGYGHPGGWSGHADLSKTGVGCESCHGPGSEHLAAPTGYGQLPADGSACVACHTHDNSPDFRWATYWPLIQHGSPVVR